MRFDKDSAGGIQELGFVFENIEPDVFVQPIMGYYGFFVTSEYIAVISN